MRLEQKFNSITWSLISESKSVEKTCNDGIAVPCMVSFKHFTGPKFKLPGSLPAFQCKRKLCKKSIFWHFFRFFKTCLQISSRNCHFGYTIWTASFQILFWIGYYLCFSWRLAIVNTHRYLLKSDDFLTSFYNDRAINLPDTLEDAEDTDRKKDSSENQKKSDKKGTSQKK